MDTCYLYPLTILKRYMIPNQWQKLMQSCVFFDHIEQLSNTDVERIGIYL